MADLATRLQVDKKEDIPSSLHTSAQRVRYNNLDQNEDLALCVHERLTEYKPAVWRSADTKEQTVKRLIYNVLGDATEMERIFEIVKKAYPTRPRRPNPQRSSGSWLRYAKENGRYWLDSLC